MDMDPASCATTCSTSSARSTPSPRWPGPRSRYVKPHGALYNARVDDAAQAEAVVAAAAEYDPSLPVLGAPGSACCERPRRPGWSRSPRRSPTAPTCATAGWCRGREPGAVVTDPAEVAARAVRLAVDHEVVARRRHRRAGAGADRCACTATRRARSSWPARSATRSTTPASTLHPFTA